MELLPPASDLGISRLHLEKASPFGREQIGYRRRVTELLIRNADQKKTTGLSKWIVGLLIIAALLAGASLMALFLLNRDDKELLSHAPILTGWLPTGKGVTRGVGGLSVFESNAKHVRFLAVFDCKHPSEPRLAFFDLEEGKLPATQDLKWPGNRWPVDLEAIAKMPGENGVFLAVTSAGELWRLRVTEDGTITVLSVTELPKADAPEIEGLDIRKLGDKLVLVWAGRGDGPRAAAVCTGIYDEATSQVSLTDRIEFRAPWPAEETVRHISDLRLDPTGTIIVTSAKDPGNNGPFDSALYPAGKVELQNGSPVLKMNGAPIRLRTDYGHKVEALEFVPGSISGLILGCDDEHGGGAILPTWRK